MMHAPQCPFVFTMDKHGNYSIEACGRQAMEFSKYFRDHLKDQPTDNDICAFDFDIDGDTDTISIGPSVHPAPVYGFHWHHEGRIIFVEAKEEGKPIDMHTYFKRMRVYHTDLEFLKAFVIHVWKASDTRKPKNINTIKLHSSNVKGYFEFRGFVSSQPFESIYLPHDLKKNIVAHVDAFIANRERYLKFGRMYKTGILLTGSPGSGKSSLVKAIAHKYKRAVYVVNLTKELTDESLHSVTQEIGKDSIMLIEDIDAFFIDRSPIGINVSFSALLNLIDGPMSASNGIITFLTANNPDRLDPALIRPGRIDQIFTFDYPKKREIMAAFKDLTECDDAEAFKIFYDVVKGSRITMSAFVDFLFRYPTDYMDHVEELLNQTRILEDITNADKKIYA